MADIREWSIGLLSRSLLVDMDTATKEDLFTVPVGKKCIVTHVVVHSSNGVLGTDNDFGGDKPFVYYVIIDNLRDYAERTIYGRTGELREWRLRLKTLTEGIALL